MVNLAIYPRIVISVVPQTHMVHNDDPSTKKKQKNNHFEKKFSKRLSYGLTDLNSMDIPIFGTGGSHLTLSFRNAVRENVT